MTLKSALQDVKETTLAAVSGLLAKLVYLGSLRRVHGRYEHWGLQLVHGQDSSERALKTAHGEVVASILRTPLAALQRDLQESSEFGQVGRQEFIDQMRGRTEEIIPEGREKTPTSSHLSSVLLALSSLERNRGRATRSTS